jgi:hypothetical protein
MAQVTFCFYCRGLKVDTVYDFGPWTKKKSESRCIKLQLYTALFFNLGPDNS